MAASLILALGVSCLRLCLWRDGEVGITDWQTVRRQINIELKLPGNHAVVAHWGLSVVKKHMLLYVHLHACHSNLIGVAQATDDQLLLYNTRCK